MNTKSVLVLDCINKFIEDNKYPPSIREIVNITGISSTSVVHYQLKKLIEAGLITYDSNSSRGINREKISPTVYVERTGKRNDRRKRYDRLLSQLAYTGGCLYCGREDVIIGLDHLVPKVLGGRDDPGNMIPSCLECNKKKAVNEPARWILENFGLNTLARVLAYACSSH